MNRVILMLLFSYLCVHTFAQYSWTENSKTIPNSYEPYLAHKTAYGYSVAIDGNYAVVGAPDYKLGAEKRGAAFVLELKNKVWQVVARLMSTECGDNQYFGNSVAIKDNLIVVGNSYRASVFVFIKPESGWSNSTQTAKLSLSENHVGGMLGQVVAISGNTVLASASGYTCNGNDGKYDRCGTVCIYEMPASGWIDMTETGKIFPQTKRKYQGFGTSIAVEGNTLVVGAPEGDRDFGISTIMKGVAYVFQKQQGQSWGQATPSARLDLSKDNSVFGINVAVSPNEQTIAIEYPRGYSGEEEHMGEVAIFEKSSGGWCDTNIETAILNAPSQSQNNYLMGGICFGADGKTFYAGSGNYQNQGCVYMYEKVDGQWQYSQQIEASDGATNGNRNFGKSIAVSDNGLQLLIGANDAAYVYAKSPATGFNKTDHLNSVKLYPNPAQDYIFIENADGSVIRKIEILNINGQQISCLCVSDGKIDIRSINKGLYLIHIKTDKEDMFIKFIKN